MLTHATTRTKKIKISSCQNNRTWKLRIIHF
jgi:hypothetical protein